MKEMCEFRDDVRVSLSNPSIILAIVSSFDSLIHKIIHSAGDFLCLGCVDLNRVGDAGYLPILLVDFIANLRPDVLCRTVRHKC